MVFLWRNTELKHVFCKVTCCQPDSRRESSQGSGCTDNLLGQCHDIHSSIDLHIPRLSSAMTIVFNANLNEIQTIVCQEILPGSIEFYKYEKVSRFGWKSWGKWNTRCRETRGRHKSLESRKQVSHFCETRWHDAYAGNPYRAFTPTTPLLLFIAFVAILPERVKLSGAAWALWSSTLGSTCCISPLMCECCSNLNSQSCNCLEEETSMCLELARTHYVYERVFTLGKYLRSSGRTLLQSSWCRCSK